MAQKITYNIDVNPGNSVKTLGQLEAELAQINEELKDVDINSQAFEDLSKASQKATRELEQANLAITGLTDEDKIRGFQGSIDIVAGSINALTGAVGFLGLESEEFEKYTAYAANAIAFSEGIRLIAQGAVDLRESLKKATFAQKLFNKATLANPYVLAGAAIVATITAIVSKFDTFVRALGDAGINTTIFSKGFDGFLDVFAGVTNVIADKAGRLVGGFIHLFNLDFDKAGASFKELFTGASIPELYQEGINIRQTQKFEKQAAADAEAYAAVFDEKLKEFLFQQELKEGAAEAAKIVFEELGDESAMSFVEAFNKTAEENELFIPEFVDPADLDFEDELNAELDAIKTKVEANKAADAEIRDSRLALLDVIEQSSEKETAIGKAAFAARQILLFQELTMQTKASLARIANTVAEGSVDASAGFLKTAKAGFPKNIPLLILYGIQVAGLIANLRNAAKAAKASTADVVAPTAPAVSAPTDLANNLGVAPESIAEQTTVRAFVVSGDVTTTQEAEAKLNAKRTLGS